MRVVNNIADLIGDTPLVKLNRIAPEGGADIYMKLEKYNPSGSVKDRAAFNMMEQAEKDGHLKKGATIIEPTSGNTGIGIAMNAAARGYKAILVMPDTMTQERINLLKAYGAEIVLTPGDEKMPGAIAKAKELVGEIEGSFMPMQFENMANPDAHRHTTAAEIIEAMDELGKPLSAFVSTAGTGGTITGTGEELKKRYEDLTIHVAEPAGSPVLSGGKPGKHKLVGTSPGFVPSILNQEVYDEIFQVTDEDAYDITRRLAREEGLLLGTSCGAACWAAIQVAKKKKPGEVIVCIAPDTGERYLSGDLFRY
ncbi:MULTISPECIES: cysteine synthase A [Halobacillus]|uniref:Cysteine synthase n=2 Tax=Halobacillus TaxID=45667 RepID=A0A3E0J9F6_9BACI|nr:MULTISPECIES: cysteine synthase A [Halobacillus]RDY72059.1 cysteine synthase A [Halobacillus trueperi]REJ09419.1 cysteine synthase A [Halobacillus trueperi]SDP58993.1 cysteine synthase A [Halobacillus aidingensis]